MRDLERINRITNKINTLWRKYPEQRLMQLLINYILPKVENDIALFYLEDDKFEEDIDKIIEFMDKQK